MGNPFIMKRGVSSVLDLKDGLAAMGLGVGNVYYVVQAANTTVYNHLMKNVQGKYADGSSKVYTTITDALAVTVSNRNDYVIVMPDANDYDEGATLTMDKNSVHLICPAGLGADCGCVRAATIDPNSAAHAITVSGRGVEIAGFWIRGYTEKYCITSTGTGCYFHHNDIAITNTTSAAGGIYINGTGHRVVNNFVFTNAGAGTALFGIQAAAGTTRTSIIGNIIQVSNGSTMSVGIQTGGNDVMCTVKDNVVHANAAGGSTGAGTLTVGIQVGTAGIACGNFITATDPLAGGTADNSYIQNFKGLNGGTVLTT